MNKSKKQKAYSYGILSEAIAVLFLRLCGYKILARRFRTKVGEIDIVAAKKDLLAIIEVKARKTTEYTEVLSYKQRKRITNAALLFIAKNRKVANLQVRFDLMIIRPYKLPDHIKNAWQEGEI